MGTALRRVGDCFIASSSANLRAVTYPFSLGVRCAVAADRAHLVPRQYSGAPSGLRRHRRAVDFERADAGPMGPGYARPLKLQPSFFLTF